MKNTAFEPLQSRIKTAIKIIESSLAKDDFPNNKRLIEICADYGIGLVEMV